MAAVEFVDDEGRVVRYVRHRTGGGLVSPTARVHEGATLAPTAYVEADAQVGDRTRIGPGSWLDYAVVIGEGVVVAGNVHVGPRTKVGAGAWIGTGARIGFDAVVESGARVPPDSIVRPGAVVHRPTRGRARDSWTGAGPVPSAVEARPSAAAGAVLVSR